MPSLSDLSLIQAGTDRSQSKCAISSQQFIIERSFVVLVSGHFLPHSNPNGRRRNWLVSIMNSSSHTKQLQINQGLKIWDCALRAREWTRAYVAIGENVRAEIEGNSRPITSNASFVNYKSPQAHRYGDEPLAALGAYASACGLEQLKPQIMTIVNLRTQFWGTLLGQPEKKR